MLDELNDSANLYAIVRGWTYKVSILTFKSEREWIEVWEWNGFELSKKYVFFSYIVGVVEIVHKEYNMLCEHSSDWSER